MVNRWFTKYLYGVNNGVENLPKSWVVREAGACPPRQSTVTAAVDELDDDRPWPTRASSRSASR